MTAVAGDITTEAGRAAALAACPEPDILVNNAGGPPPGDFRNWDRDDWIKAIDANMLTPIDLIKAMVDGMCARKFGRIVNITSASVKSPIAVLGMTNGARAGLTGFVAGLARQVALHNVTINACCPGRSSPTGCAAARPRRRRQPAAAWTRCSPSARRRSPAGRVGDPAEFGDACAFLCAASSGFIIGQNLLLDGGAFNSTMG